MSAKKGKYMALTPEKKVKLKVAALLKERGVYYFSPATFGMGRSGVPDIICCHLGKFIGVECKAGVNKPTELQKRELAAIEKAGGVALVINETNLDLLTRALSTIERGH
jgi:Holliday junction resolvase